MTSTGRRVTTLGALLAVVAAAIVVYLSTGRSTGVTMASAAGAPMLTIEQIERVMLTEADHPRGTTFEQAPIDPANQAVEQGGMVVTPDSCMGALQITLGPDARVTGLTQVGSQPGSANRTPFQSAVAAVAGGLDLNRMREVVATCKNGTVSWPDRKLTASISLTEAPAPRVEGMRTFAYKSTMKFTNVTASELAAAVSACSLSAAADLGTVQTVAQECVTHKDAPQERMDVTTEQFVAYAAVGSIYIEACGAMAAQTQQMLVVPSDRLRAAGHI